MNLFDYFETVYENLRTTERDKGNSSDYYLSVGGYVIQLHFASPALIPFVMPAFEHLATDPKNPADLTVCLWDGSGDHSRMPPSPSWNDNAFSCPFYLSNDRFSLTCETWPHRLNLFDRERNLALYWIHDARDIPWYEKGSPLRFIMAWWASSRGYQFIHGAAVGTQTGGVLLAGESGTGKSTAVLACLDSELKYAADDYCILTGDTEPFILSIYCTGKLKGARDVERFPHLRPLLVNQDRLDKEKAMLFFTGSYKEKLINKFPLKAILLPAVTMKKETILKRSDWYPALKKIFHSTAKQKTNSSPEDFYSICRVAKRVPSYVLEAGTDLKRIPDVILELLAREG